MCDLDPIFPALSRKKWEQQAVIGQKNKTREFKLETAEDFRIVYIFIQSERTVPVTSSTRASF